MTMFIGVAYVSYVWRRCQVIDTLGMTETLGLFAPGFVLGFVLSGVLAALGVMLRLREEALAAFSYAHVAVLGAMLAALLGWPLLVGAWGLAVLLAVASALILRTTGEGTSSRYLMILLIAWSLGLLLADNHPEARLLSASAIEGQLLLVGWSALPAFIGVGLLGGFLLAAGARRWFAKALLPWRRHSVVQGQMIEVKREVAVVALLAAGALALGVFVTLALVLVPAWVSWFWASSLRRAMLSAAVLGVGSHIVAFSLSLAFDQVYSAVLIITLAAVALLAAGLAWAGQRRTAARGRSPRSNHPDAASTQPRASAEENDR